MNNDKQDIKMMNPQEYESRLRLIKEVVKNYPPPRQEGDVITLDEIKNIFYRLSNGLYGKHSINERKKIV